MENEYVDLVWSKHPDYIRQFHKNKELYSTLCQEIEFILKKKLLQREIEIASISTRTKSEASFCEKLYRKDYSNPFTQITDFAGARVVFLYSSDKSAIEDLIETEFQILEKIDKVSGADEDKFGYGALHYLIKLKTEYVGVRYEEVKELICEIQIRTILQDSWAMVAHHLSYKHESDVPKHLRRKLNALSGLFETADDQFENIRSSRAEHSKTVSEKIQQHNAETLNSEIELDSLIAFLDLKFPDRKSNDSSASELISELKKYGYNSLKELEDIIDKTIDAVSAYEEAYPPLDRDNKLMPTIYSQVGAVRSGLGFVNMDYLYRHDETREDEPNELQFMHLVKK